MTVTVYKMKDLEFFPNASYRSLKASENYCNLRVDTQEKLSTQYGYPPPQNETHASMLLKNFFKIAKNHASIFRSIQGVKNVKVTFPPMKVTVWREWGGRPLSGLHFRIDLRTGGAPAPPPPLFGFSWPLITLQKYGTYFLKIALFKPQPSSPVS